jgi:hypothetical protein
MMNILFLNRGKLLNFSTISLTTQKRLELLDRQAQPLCRSGSQRYGELGSRKEDDLLKSSQYSQAIGRRWIKKNLYTRSPLFLRAFLYFLMRYIIGLGFLDGLEGLIFHFLQGFWYRCPSRCQNL